MCSTEANAASIVLGEYTFPHHGLESMGYTYSKPTIVLLNNVLDAIMTGNGYNNSSDGKAYLFVIYLDGTTPVLIEPGSSGSPGRPQRTVRLAVVDNNDDGVADYAYAGEMYVIFTDLTSAPSRLPEDRIRRPTAHYLQNLCGETPTESGTNTSPEILVFFGTGQYPVDADKTRPPPTPSTAYGMAHQNQWPIPHPICSPRDSPPSVIIGS